MKKIENFIKTSLKEKIPNIRPGDTVKIYQKIPASAKKGAKEKAKEKIQVFEGIVIAKKHGQEAGATITVRKVVDGIGVERIFPLHLPTLEKIEITKRSKVRRAKLYYLRKAKGKRARLKRVEIKDKIGLRDKIETKLTKPEETRRTEVTKATNETKEIDETKNTTEEE